MNVRDWTTLIVRTAGLLAALALFPRAFGWASSIVYLGYRDLWPHAWTEFGSGLPAVAIFALGGYSFFGGRWIINRLLRGIGNGCPRCGYDLSGLDSGRCPECGAKVR